ncbi:hypothetical protein [Pedobacter sp. MR2016-24]|uniref:hypothetical protein n=1 Tax=Pedobacter sp. MR2016-24 TaxID=2994466 RepID=UPI002245A128|nr:hypothetical protein [Pedobacter sp. MR2016-24]MCX2486599.1 hypothetical protein [Pedobacter sp. MR2016-24]
MAITIIQQPQKYTPSNSDILLQFKTVSIYFRYFIVEVLNSAGVVISSQKLKGIPTSPKEAFTNLVSILSDAAKTSINNSTNLIEYTPNDLYKYSIRIKEYDDEITSVGGVFRPTGNVILDSTTLISDLYVFNAKIEYDYDFTTVVATASGTGRFLTNKPDKCDIQPIATEYLYYLNDGRASKIRFIFYYSTGTSVTKTVAITTTQKIGRINISPLVLQVNGSVLTDLKYYTIELLDVNNNVAVQPVYRYLNTFKSISNVQVFWANTSGGIDSYLFKNVRESVAVTKVSTVGNPYKLDSNGKYSKYNADKYNATDVTLKSDSLSTYTVVSEYLTNPESKWLTTSLLGSKQVYVMIEGNKLYPVSVTDKGGAIQNTRYGGQLNSFEFSFTMETSIPLQKFTGEEFFPYTLPITF